MLLLVNFSYDLNRFYSPYILVNSSLCPVLLISLKLQGYVGKNIYVRNREGDKNTISIELFDGLLLESRKRFE